jgi:hypothetical protein
LMQHKTTVHAAKPAAAGDPAQHEKHEAEAQDATNKEDSQKLEFRST